MYVISPVKANIQITNNEECIVCGNNAIEQISKLVIELCHRNIR